MKSKAVYAYLAPASLAWMAIGGWLAQIWAPHVHTWGPDKRWAETRLARYQGDRRRRKKYLEGFVCGRFDG